MECGSGGQGDNDLIFSLKRICLHSTLVLCPASVSQTIPASINIFQLSVIQK